MANTQEQVSLIMRRNKSRDTKPELMLRKELWARGLRYRKNYKKACGKPDVAFVGLKIAVFADGKMWHGYDWENQRGVFKANPEYWIPKIERNMERDRQVNERLTSEGWIVLRFWDFEIAKDVSGCADKVEEACRERTAEREGRTARPTQGAERPEASRE